MKKRGLIICMVILSILCSKTALKAAAAETTPWQTYLDKAPAQAEQFAADPLGTLLRLFAAEPVQLLRDALQQYAAILLFLSLAAGLAGRCLVLAAVWPLLEQIFQTIWGLVG